MPVYRYRAVDEEGKASTGTMAEISAQRVTAILSEQGLQVNSVEEINRNRLLPRLRKTLSWNDLNTFNEQLLAVTRSGLPLSPALDALAKDLRSWRLRAVLRDVRDQLESGASLETALRLHENSFPPVYLSMIRAGERTGNLEGVLTRLTDYSSRMVETRNRLQEVLAYPLLVLAVTLAIGLFFLVNIVPTYGDILKDFGGRLPWVTAVCLRFCGFINNHFAGTLILCVPALIVAIIVLKSLLYTRSLGYHVDWFKLRVWLLGRLYRASSMARFCQSLGLLLTSGVPVVESLTLAGATSGNAVLERAASRAAELVNGGERISDALEGTGEFEHTFSWLLGAAEERGEIHETLLGLGESYERTVARLGKTSLTLLGPVLVLLLGLFLGGIAVALYLPMITLADSIIGI